MACFIHLTLGLVLLTTTMAPKVYAIIILKESGRHKRLLFQKKTTHNASTDPEKQTTREASITHNLPCNSRGSMEGKHLVETEL